MNEFEKFIEDVFDDDFETVKRAESFDLLDSWDSLTHVNLVVRLQTTFGLDLTAEQVKALNSVAQIEQLLREKGKA